MKVLSQLSLLLVIGLLTTLSFSGCATIPIEERIDYKPMYGQPEIPRPEHMKKADEDFINKAVSGFGGSRELASKAWAKVADEFLSRRDFYNAMRRYNQSWLLNPNNYHPYHGFGQIMLTRSEYDKAIKYMEKARELVKDPFQEPAVLSDTGIVYTYKALYIPPNNKSEREKLFQIANQHFEEATKKDMTYTDVWRRWAISLFEQGDYSGAWEKVKKARSLGATPLPPKFLSLLRAEMPEPK